MIATLKRVINRIHYRKELRFLRYVEDQLQGGV